MLAGPVVSAKDGATYVGTTAGLVHKLGVDGRFLWSYNVRGAVVGRLALGSAGLVYAATANARLWALLPGGTALWVHRSSTAPVTGVILRTHRTGKTGAERRTSLHFGGADEHLHSVADNGTARWRAPMFSPISAGPAPAPDGALVAATSDARVVFVRGVLARKSAKMAAVVIEAPVVDGDAVFVVAGERLVALDLHGNRRWHRDGVRFAPALFAGGMVVSEGNAVVWLDRAGSERRRFHVAHDISASVAVAASGEVFIPTRSGSLVVLDPRAGTMRSIRVGRAAVHAPVLDAARRRVLATSGDGVVAAFERSGDI